VRTAVSSRGQAVRAPEERCLSACGVVTVRVMPTTGAIVRLVIVALLSAYLFVKGRERRRLKREADAAYRAKWPPQTIDVSQLLPRVQSVRGDHTTKTPVSRSQMFSRRGLLALARKAVRGFPYFLSRQGDEAESQRVFRINR